MYPCTRLFICMCGCLCVGVYWAKRKEKKRKKRKENKIGIPFDVYVCIACVGLATVDPIQLSHAQPNHIQSNVLWHLIKSRSAERIFCMCGCLCVGVYKASPWRREITTAPSRCNYASLWKLQQKVPSSTVQKEKRRRVARKRKEMKRKEKRCPTHCICV